jgi:outer membrane protein
MRPVPLVILTLACAGGVAARASAQPPPLTLAQAEQTALKNHPQIQAAQSGSEAARQVVRETRAAYFPTAFGSVTAVDADSGTRIAAGGLNNPVLYDRFGTGVTVGQLVTDFGRTHALVQSTALTSQAEEQNVLSARATVLLEVDRAYFGVLRAQAVQRVAQDTVNERQLVSDQVAALAASGLKSGLDATFAQVNLSSAQLLLVQAQNDTGRAFAALATTLGGSTPTIYALTEEAIPPAPPDDAGPLVAAALRDRPEIVAARFSEQSAAEFARAEGDLALPSVSALGSFGVVPAREAAVADRYAAVGVNVNVPIFNGNLYAARHTSAAFRAQAAAENERDLENRIARDVHVAWLNARTAFQRLDLTNQLLAQASQALDLAQSRYDLGLSSIVELSQAQLNKTEAELEQTSAKYEYQVENATLQFQIGARK